MPTPVAPSEFLEAVVLPTDDEGISIVKAHVIFPALFTGWYTYAFDANMNFTPAFAADLCAIVCASHPGEAPLEVPTPNQWREAVASVGGDLCERFRASLAAPGLFYDWYSSVYNEDKTFTDEFKAQICSIVCPASPSLVRMTIPTPAEVLALVPTVGGDYCTKFYNALLFNGLVGNFFAAMYQENRKFTPEFKAQYCALNCASGSVGAPPPTTPGVGNTPTSPPEAHLAAPTLGASTNIAGEIRLQWSTVAGAELYRLFRHVSGGYTPVYQGAATYFDDAGAPVRVNTTYIAVAYKPSTGNVSPSSNIATGYRPS